jgi:hypothetical protein
MTATRVELLTKFEILDEGHGRVCAGCGVVVSDSEKRLIRSARFSEESDWQFQQAWHFGCSVPQWLSVERLGPGGYLLLP